MDVRAGDGAGFERMVQVADLRGLLQRIDDRQARRIKPGIDFVLVGIVGADRGDEGAGLHQLGRQEGAAGRRARHDDVALPHDRKVGRGPHVELERGRHLVRQPFSRLAVDIPDMHPIEFHRRRDRRELDAALHARAADRRHAGVAARQMAGRRAWWPHRCG